MLQNYPAILRSATAERKKSFTFLVIFTTCLHSYLNFIAANWPSSSAENIKLHCDLEGSGWDATHYKWHIH